MSGMTAARGLLAGACLGLLFLAGCGRVETAVTAVPSPATSALEPVVEPAAAATVGATATAAITSTPLAPPVDTPTPPSTVTSIPSATPHPIAPYTIEGLRAREYPGGEIEVVVLLEENEHARRYLITYPSDGLTIGGTLTIPRGQGPYPVILLLHGYFERDQYWSGADTWQAADYLASSGYLTIAPDYRSWGASDEGVSFFHTGLVADVINLISALPSLPQADPGRVALLGHSMGGGIATKVLVVDDRVKAAVLYSPNSADDADLIDRWGPGCLPGQSQKAGDHCNPGEFIPAGLPEELVDAYLAATADAQMLQRIAPIYHLALLQTPVQIHSGEADGELLVHTPPAWARKLFEALQAAGKTVDYYSYADQGHYFTSPAWDEMMARSLSFFDSYLKP